MTRSELVEKVQRKFPHLTNKNVEKIVGVIFNTISDALVSDRRVEFRGFGSFTVRKRESRVGRNPRTGEQVKVSAKAIPFFKHSRGLKDKLNPGQK